MLTSHRQHVCHNGNFLCPIVAGEPLSYCSGACYSKSMYTCAADTNTLAQLAPLLGGARFDPSLTNPFAGAKEIFRYIPENSVNRLALQSSDFSRSNWSYYTCYTDKFVSLAGESLRLGLLEPLTRVAEESRNVFDPAAVSRNVSKDSVAHFLNSMATKLRELDTPLTPALKAFFETFLRAGVLYGRPNFPIRLPGWTHKRRGCAQPACEDCETLDTFTLFETQEIFRFEMGNENRRDHLASWLPHSLFNRERLQSGVTRRLVVTKLGRSLKLSYLRTSPNCGLSKSVFVP